MKTLGIIGVGELTEKMVHGLIRSSNISQVYLSPRNHEKALNLSRAYGCKCMLDNQSVIDASDIVLIGVRPNQLTALADEIRIKPAQCLISVVAGVSIKKLQQLFSHEYCVRAMLSYAAEINKSTVVVYPQNTEVQELLNPLGNLIGLAKESEFELATVSACMNGWFYFLLHDLQTWLVDKGLEVEQARALVLSSLEDCTAYARHHAALPMNDLGRSIATPGTFTAQGLEMLGLHQANAAWGAACEVVLDALLSQSVSNGLIE